MDLSTLDICFLSGTLGQGGAEQQLFYILKTLREHGAAVRLLTLTAGEYWEQPIRDLGVPVTFVGRPPARSRRLARILRELRSDKPAVFQAQHFYTNLYVALAARALGLRGIGAMRNDGVSEQRDIGWAMGRLSLHLPRAIAANSMNGIRNAVAWGVPESRLHLLRNVVDTERFAPAPKPDDGVIRLLAVGRLAPQKRVDRFVRIAAALRAQTARPLEAVIVGDGPLRSRIEQQARALGLTPEALRFAGRTGDPRPFYTAADVLVLTSDWEGTPNVLMEAMASGLPVVAARVGDAPDLVEEGETGFTFAPDDEAAAVSALGKLVASDSIRATMGARARAVTLERDSLLRLPQRLQQFYQNIVE